VAHSAAAAIWAQVPSRNPGPLACHQQAARPPACFPARHRPSSYTPVHSRALRLLYFRAVPLPTAASGCGSSCRCSTSTSTRSTSGSGLRARREPRTPENASLDTVPIWMPLNRAGTSGDLAPLLQAVRKWWFEADTWRGPVARREYLARLFQDLTAGSPPPGQRVSRTRIRERFGVWRHVPPGTRQACRGPAARRARGRLAWASAARRARPPGGLPRSPVRVHRASPDEVSPVCQWAATSAIPEGAPNAQLLQVRWAGCCGVMGMRRRRRWPFSSPDGGGVTIRGTNARSAS